MRFPWRKPKRRWESSLEVFLRDDARLFFCAMTRDCSLRDDARLFFCAMTRGWPCHVSVRSGSILPPRRVCYNCSTCRLAPPAADAVSLPRGADTFVAKIKEPVNAFYVLLVIVGVAFFVTAFAYGAMSYLAIQPARAREIGSHALWSFLDRQGVQLLGVELGLLAGATYGAMWLDGYRLRQKPRELASSTDEGTEAEPGRKIG